MGCICCKEDDSDDPFQAHLINGGMNSADDDARSKTTLLSATIVNSQLVKNNNPHTLYEIQVEKSGEVLWKVFRRYSDFEALFEDLERRIPKNRLPTLPPTKWCNSTDEEFVKKRQKELDYTLRKLMKNSLVAQDPHFRSFLSDGKIAAPNAIAITPLMRVEDFELLAVVGRGSYAKVLQVRKKDTGKVYALKILQKQHLVARNVVANALAERKILANLSHPFIVSLHYSFQTHDKLYLVVDYFNGGELFYHLRKQGRFTEACAKFFVSEVILAVEHLHDNGIIYRDLKPENILLDQDGHIRLTDFGLSKEGLSKGVLTRTFCGTPSYASPEMLTRSPYDKTVDWWCVGILLYEMLTGVPPFRHRNTRVMFDHILHAELLFPDYVTRDARDLIGKLLQRDPKKRLGANGAAEIRKHPFFNSVNWKKCYQKRIDPPFRPAIDAEIGSLDVSNVSTEFIRQVAADTPTQTSTLNTTLAFPDFTYDENEHMNQYLTSGATGNSPLYSEYGDNKGIFIKQHSIGNSNILDAKMRRKNSSRLTDSVQSSESENNFSSKTFHDSSSLAYDFNILGTADSPLQNGEAIMSPTPALK